MASRKRKKIEPSFDKSGGKPGLLDFGLGGDDRSTRGARKTKAKAGKRGEAESLFHQALSQVPNGRVLNDTGDGFLAVRGDVHLAAQPVQHAHGDLLVDHVVVDDQHA